MRRALLACLAAAATACATPASGALERISSRDASSALKAALEKSAHAAVASLGKTDGFFANPHVRIALPESLERAEKLMRRLGMGRQADELILALNRAAEAAVPEARALLIASIRKMTWQDAKDILQGGETAGTAYFRRSTEEELRARFLPIVQRATARVGLAQHYNRYAEKGAALGLVEKDEANLDEYVTQKALDGLFLMAAEEERKIRKDPLRAGSAIIRKVFGAL